MGGNSSISFFIQNEFSFRMCGRREYWGQWDRSVDNKLIYTNILMTHKDNFDIFSNIHFKQHNNCPADNRTSCKH